MPVKVVQKIRDLAQAGATMVGPKPESDPGLKNDPQCDAFCRRDRPWDDRQTGNPFDNVARNL